MISEIGHHRELPFNDLEDCGHSSISQWCENPLTGAKYDEPDDITLLTFLTVTARFFYVAPFPCNNSGFYATAARALGSRGKIHSPCVKDVVCVSQRYIPFFLEGNGV